MEEILVEAKHEFLSRGGRKKFLEIPCLNDDEWCKNCKQLIKDLQ
jgi:hypothetical protein